MLTHTCNIHRGLSAFSTKTHDPSKLQYDEMAKKVLVNQFIRELERTTATKQTNYKQRIKKMKRALRLKVGSMEVLLLGPNR